MAETTRPARPRPTRKGRKNKMSEEGRQRLSELMKKRHQTGEIDAKAVGKLGGRGNTREKRLAQRAVAEAAGEHREEIIEVFRDAIDKERPMGQRLKGAELWLKVEEANEKLALAEERAAGEQLSRDQLIAAIVQGLTSGPAAAIIRGQLEGETIVDAEVIED